MLFFFFSLSGDHRDRHVLTHSFPTRRSSDLGGFRALARLSSRQYRAGGRHRDGGPLGQQLHADDRYLSRGAEGKAARPRSEEHTSELQSLMRISYAVFCLKKKKQQKHNMNQQVHEQRTVTKQTQ